LEFFLWNADIIHRARRQICNIGNALRNRGLYLISAELLLRRVGR
jgi:hypothetical protein